MRKVISDYIDQFNETLNLQGICWWIIDFETDSEHYYCNDYMKEVFSLDKSLSKFSISQTCPIAGDYNKNITLTKEDYKNKEQVFNDYKKLLNNQSDEYVNKFSYYNNNLNEQYYFLSRAKVLKRDENDNISILYGVIVDRTNEEKQNLSILQYKRDAELKNKILNETNEKLLGLYKLSPLGIALTDMKGNYLEFNESFEKICGYPKDELKQLDYWSLTPKKYQDKELEQLEKLNTKGFYGPYEKEYKQKNGKLIPINLNGMLITDENGNQYIWSIVEDISNRKKSEETILQQSKMAAMGEMLGNIAHQWRQPLSMISTSATGMIFKKEMNSLSDKDFNSYCESINENAQYLSQTIDDFKNFIKGDRRKISFNLKRNIDSFLNLVKGSIKNYNIEIYIDIDENITINSYPNELIQCYINLFNNAIDALKEKETNKCVFINVKEKSDNLIITFKDNAGGIPQNVISKIFEPYFTTKHKSQGTGLGLSMTYNLIVDGMGGLINVTNSTYTHEGSTFTGAEFQITLPLI